MDKKKDGRGGAANALYEACPGSNSWPWAHEVYPPEVIALAHRGWGLTKTKAKCPHCQKLLVLLKNGQVPRHKRQHEKGWERES